MDTTARLFFACCLQARPVGRAALRHPFPAVFFKWSSRATMPSAADLATA